MPEPAVEALPEWVDFVGPQASTGILIFVTVILFWGLSVVCMPAALEHTHLSQVFSPTNTRQHSAESTLR